MHKKISPSNLPTHQPKFSKPNITTLKKLWNLVYLLFAICYLLSTTPIHAAVELGDQFLLKEGTTVKSEFPSISSIISNILPNVYIFSGLILFFILLGGGFMMISAGGNPENIEKGKQAAVGAIIGFIIIFMSFWIIQIIEILTGVQILNSTFINNL